MIRVFACDHDQNEKWIIQISNLSSGFSARSIKLCSGVITYYVSWKSLTSVNVTIMSVWPSCQYSVWLSRLCKNQVKVTRPTGCTQKSPRLLDLPPPWHQLHSPSCPSEYLFENYLKHFLTHGKPLDWNWFLAFTWITIKTNHWTGSKNHKCIFHFILLAWF